MNATKEWLLRGRRIEREIDALDAARRETFERLTSATAQTDSVHAQGSKDPHALEAYAALADKVDHRIADLISVRVEIIEAISSLPNPIHREILLNYYVRGLSWREVADLEHYDIRSVFRIHGSALLALQDVIDCHTCTSV